MAGKRDEYYQRGIDKLPGNCRADSSRPEPLTISPEFHLRERVRVCEFTRPESNQAREHKTRHGVEDCFKGTLVRPV